MKPSHSIERSRLNRWYTYGGRAHYRVPYANRADGVWACAGRLSTPLASIWLYTPNPPRDRRCGRCNETALGTPP